MKRFIIVVIGVLSLNCHLLAQNMREIQYLYSNAINNWELSSKQALPFFEKLYYQIEPLYNRYYTNNFIISDEIHKVSRNYIRFMNEYYLKGFGGKRGKQYIENAWKMSQTIKGYEALKEYNSLRLQNFKNDELLEVINNTDIYDYVELRKLNKLVDIQTNNILFLEIPTIQEIQNKLQNDDLYISFSFSLNDRSFFIISISKTDVDVYKSKITTYELFNRIAVIKGIINEDRELKYNGNINLSVKGLHCSDKLDDNLLPLEMEINHVINKYNVKNLIVENDIIISQVPFDLLNNNKIPYYKNFNITYVPNASYFVKLHNSSNFDNTIVGISPKVVEEDVRIEQEINILKDLFENVIFLTDCSKNSFLSFINENRSYDILHLSSHFNKELLKREIEKIEMNGNYYYLNNLSKKDGYFSFGDSNVSIQDIFSHNQSKVKTLILSGCETATSDDVLSIINPLLFIESENDEKLSVNFNVIINQGCYCNNTKSFDNLFLTAMSFSPQYIIAFQNFVDQESSWKFFNEFYLNYQEYKDTKKAFFVTKRSLMDLNDSGYFDYASVILICK